MLAVDGGQSAIRVRHSVGPAVVELAGVSRQEGDTVEAVAAAVVEGWRQTGGPPVDRAVLGLTTLPADHATRSRLADEIARRVDAAEVWLADDAVIAHAGALDLGWGVSITAGTGVACLALPPEGEPRTLGGHGFLLGDEGGAFWIGREGIRAALRAREGRGPATALVGAAARRFDGLDGLPERLHDLARPVDRIARFASDVLEVAASADPVADGILALAIDELVGLARAAVAHVGGETRVPLTLGGRLLEGGPLRRRLDAALAGSLPEADVRSSHGGPLDGALLLGQADDPGRYRALIHAWRATARAATR